MGRTRVATKAVKSKIPRLMNAAMKMTNGIVITPTNAKYEPILVLNLNVT